MYGSQDANSGSFIANTPSKTQVSGFSHSVAGSSTKCQIHAGSAYPARGTPNNVACMVRANSPTRLVSSEVSSGVDLQSSCKLNSSASGAFPTGSPQHVFQEEVRKELHAQAKKLAQVEETIRSDMRAQTATMMESVMSKQREFASRMKEIVAAEEIVTEQVRARSAVVADLEVRMIDMAMSISALRGDFEKISKSQNNPIPMSTLQEDAEQEFLARLDEVMEREATARKQLEQKISTRFNSVMVELVGRQTSSLANLLSKSASASGVREEGALDDIQSGNFQFQCRLLEQQVTALCTAVSTLVEKCPESSGDFPAAYAGVQSQAPLSVRSISFEGDSFDGNATPDLLTATSVFANVALDEQQQLSAATSQSMVHSEGTDSITQGTQPMTRLLANSRPAG